MDYIAIKNNGYIEEKDLYLIGSSTKRDDDTKIGIFGSGWKFALAWFMRNGCKVTIYSGKEEIKIGTVTVDHRGTNVEVITVNGKSTSLTTMMGIKWTGWMALREVIANAIDEGGFEFEVDSAITPKEDTTVIYIGINDEIKGFINNFDNYFCFNRKDGIKITNSNSFDSINSTIYIKETASPVVVYRKGIRCVEKLFNSYIDFDFYELEINESRIADNWDICNKISSLFNSNDITYDILVSLLKTTINLSDTVGYSVTVPDKMSSTVKTILTNKVVDNKLHLVSDLYIKTFGTISIQSDNYLVIPHPWYSSFVRAGLIEDIYDILLGIDAPTDFIRIPANFDVEGLHRLISHIADFEIISGSFKTSYESVRVVDTTVYIYYDVKDSLPRLAASIVRKLNNNVLVKYFETIN